jgi:hypothetical protein
MSVFSESASPLEMEAEKALLGAILVDNQCFHRVSDFLKPEHFQQKIHQRIFDIAGERIRDGKSVTTVTLKPHLPADLFADLFNDTGGFKADRYLGRLLTEATTIINAEDYGRTIYDLAIRRRTEPKEPATNFASFASFAWPTMDDAAYHGVAGDIVRTFLPHTEADPNALLIQILAMAGNVIDRLPYYPVESDHHRANLFAVLVGDSAKARKGTSLSRRSATRIGTIMRVWSRWSSGGGSSEGDLSVVAHNQLGIPSDTIRIDALRGACFISIVLVSGSILRRKR